MSVWGSICCLYLDAIYFPRFENFYAIISLNRFSVPLVIF
jgi:hypothetical protein